MEYRRRSLWNRVWDDQTLDDLSREEHNRVIWEEEYHPWREIGHGLVLSLWKGAVWMLRWPWLFKEKIETESDEL